MMTPTFMINIMHCKFFLHDGRNFLHDGRNILSLESMPFCVIFSQWHNVYEFDDSMNMYYLGLQAAKGYLIVGMEDKMF